MTVRMNCQTIALNKSPHQRMVHHMNSWLHGTIIVIINISLVKNLIIGKRSVAIIGKTGGRKSTIIKSNTRKKLI